MSSTTPMSFHVQRILLALVHQSSLSQQRSYSPHVSMSHRQVQRRSPAPGPGIPGLEGGM